MYNSIGAIEVIFPTSFVGLSRLKSLNLAVSKIRSIPNGTFRELGKLETLDISYGLVDFIGVSAFQGLGALESLDLSYNNISTIHPLVFNSLSSLLYLYLQNNFLQSLSPTTFENMPYLLDLNLANNLLTTVTRENVSPLLNLRTLDVHGNQLETIDEMFHGITSDVCEKIDASYNKVWLLAISSLEILGIVGKTVNVDLSHNNLQILYHTPPESYISEDVLHLSLSLDLRWNQFASFPLELATYRSFSRSRISIREISGQKYGDISLLMTQNPLICDCALYELIVNLDVAKQGVLYTKTDFQDMVCAVPDELRGRRVVDLRPSELWCSEECYNRFYACFCYEHEGEMFKSPQPWCFPEHNACPSECSCSFQGQLHSATAPYNELVNCAGRNLSSIPVEISNVTTILHLEGNQLRVISQTVLPELLMVRELYLNDNNISYVGAMAFSAFNSLEILRLDGNNISNIGSTIFKSLSNLRELYLNHSGVRYLSVDTFHDLASLQKLHLENNRLQSLPENMFAGLKKLRSLSIHGNPLNCDCDVLWFANWLRSRAFLLAQGHNVSCLTKTKVARDILSVSSSQLDCDDVQAARARNRLIVGVSIPMGLVIIILVCVIVIVRRKEAIQVYLYARYGWRFREEEEDEDKEYDAFLSYSQHDLDVVLHDILPALENREPPFRVCLHHRDFLPGVPIAENIATAVNSSKRTIILLSNNFLESDWCQFEFQAAHAQMLQDRANRVIVVLLDDVPAENAPPDIQHYLNTNTYLRWGDERFWERLIYVMPRPRPHAQDEDGDQLAMVELDHNR
ncbi:toll-like receptor Tollo [Branchiostoma floridae]|uniref:Toll-like receptor Tollo n=1 Tax=Branchiostoma floridae TaxID=7739 RepID=A0A9J7HD45_BRAFL|nr:toll-like receptor Tollo [Branchiostoma floridae]